MGSILDHVFLFLQCLTSCCSGILRHVHLCLDRIAALKESRSGRQSEPNIPQVKVEVRCRFSFSFFLSCPHPNIAFLVHIFPAKVQVSGILVNNDSRIIIVFLLISMKLNFYFVSHYLITSLDYNFLMFFPCYLNNANTH